ncbi:MAG: DNA translocase FtsK, partial [Oscillospiraceae bacterium]|nr:DNA translocase FtsK [Oscillospiraceae bacterium]
GIPHLLIPVVTDPKKAAGALQWSVMEMMKRYTLMRDSGARDLASYNKLMEKTEGGQKLPKIAILIDELADLMMTAAKEVEESICRIAQMGRAAGIHLVIATQRPSADVITGLMKANISSRIAFAVDSALNSRIILDTSGAEKLVGKGDMLYAPIGAGKPTRIQGAFVTDEEREEVINFVKEQGLANYNPAIQDEIERAADKDSKKASQEDEDEEEDSGELDELFNEAVEVVLDSKQASVSMLQRRLKLGYSRAARIVDQMEEQGVVGPFEGSKPRAVLLTREEWAARQGGGAVPPPVTPPSLPEEDEDDGGVPEEID